MLEMPSIVFGGNAHRGMAEPRRSSERQSPLEGGHNRRRQGLHSISHECRRRGACYCRQNADWAPFVPRAMTPGAHAVAEGHGAVVIYATGFGTFQSLEQRLDRLLYFSSGVPLKVAHRPADMEIPITQIGLITAASLRLPNMSRWYLHCLPGDSFIPNTPSAFEVPLACTRNISSVLFAVSWLINAF